MTDARFALSRKVCVSIAVLVISVVGPLKKLLDIFTSFGRILYHSHKKHKDSLERRAELAVLRTYVEKQAILEPIFLYRASKCKQTKEQGSRLMFLPFYKIMVSCFSFLCKDENKTRSNCAIIGSNLSKKHKLTLYKTQNGEPNYVDHKFFFNFY